MTIIVQPTQSRSALSWLGPVLGVAFCGAVGFFWILANGQSYELGNALQFSRQSKVHGLLPLTFVGLLGLLSFLPPYLAAVRRAGQVVLPTWSLVVTSVASAVVGLIALYLSSGIDVGTVSDGSENRFGAVLIVWGAPALSGLVFVACLSSLLPRMGFKHLSPRLAIVTMALIWIVAIGVFFVTTRSVL